MNGLVSNGFKVSIEARGLNVTPSALVVTKGMRRNNFYFLQGKTIVAFIATVETTCGKAKLWHMRVDHVGENAIQCLLK